MNQKRAVAFAINDGYISHLEIALFSLLKNNQNSLFNIYVLSGDLKQANIRKLERICDNQKNAYITVIKPQDGVFTSLKVNEHFSKDMYSRYLLPELLPHEKKVLYLDADILVTGDISELYDTQLSDMSLAAIKDIGIQRPQFTEYMDSLGLDGQNYFNSGVLLMNLDKMRKNNTAITLIETTKKFDSKLRHPDQDVINIVFKRDIQEVSSIWNFQDEDRRIELHSLADVKIVHYTTNSKPWNTPNIARGYNKAAHEVYEQYEYEYYVALGYAKKVSVIIPVYNTKQEYIRECMSSVLGQVYRDLEVVIVDDGSDRKTAEYLDNLAKKDDRIKVLHRKNAGTNQARKTGFIESTGEYILFIDGDDIVSPNMVLKLFRSCLDNNSDMAVCEYWSEYEAESVSASLYEDGLVIGRDDISRCRYMGFPGVRLAGVVWAKLYKRAVVQKIDWEFSNYALVEDEFMNLQIFAYTERVSLVRDQLYFYRQQVATSKESSYPAYNKFDGKSIPMIQTAGDLYKKSKIFYDKHGIQYDDGELALNYVAILHKHISKLIDCGGFNDDNRRSLAKQEEYFTHVYKALDSDYYKVMAVILFNAPDYIGDYTKLIQAYESEKSILLSDLTMLRGENASLRKENEDFLGVKRSARLFAGNIKRKVRIRTRLRNLRQ